MNSNQAKGQSDLLKTLTDVRDSATASAKAGGPMVNPYTNELDGAAAQLYSVLSIRAARRLGQHLASRLQSGM